MAKFSPQFVHYSADGLVLLANPSHFAIMVRFVLATITVTFDSYSTSYYYGGQEVHFLFQYDETSR